MAMEIPIVMANTRARYETPMQSADVSFEDVPIEIVVTICQFIPQELRAKMRLVSKKWRQALYDDTFTNVPIEGSAVFFLPNMQLTPLGNYQEVAGHRISMDLPRWVANTEPGLRRFVPWSFVDQLGIEFANYTFTGDGPFGVDDCSVGVGVNTEKLKAYLEKNCQRSLRPTKSNEEAAARGKHTLIQPLFGYKPMKVSLDSVLASTHSEDFGLNETDADPYDVTMNDAYDEIESVDDVPPVPVKQLTPREPWQQSNKIKRLLISQMFRDEWIHAKTETEYGYNAANVWRVDSVPLEVTTRRQKKENAPASETLILDDPYAASVLFGGKVIHPGSLTLINGRCFNGSTERFECGIWICVNKIVLNSLLLNIFLDNGESSSKQNEEILRGSLFKILSIEHKHMEQPRFSFSSPHASLHNPKTAPSIDAVPWHQGLSLYDFQKETVRSMAQLEAQIASRKPVEMYATSVLTCCHTLGMLYVDKTQCSVLSANEGYALKTGATKAHRTDNVLFYTQGGALMDEVGMGKTRQIVALVAHFPVSRLATEAPGSLVTRAESLDIEYTTDWHTDMIMVDRSAICRDWPVNKLKLDQRSILVDAYRIEYVTSSATLVICGNHLVEQWCNEAAHAFACPPNEKNRRVIVIGSKRDHESVTLEMFAKADMVIVTVQFLCGLYYRNARNIPNRYKTNDKSRRLIPEKAEPGARSVLLDTIEWARLVVDEVSTLKNNATKSKQKQHRTIIQDIHCLRSVTRWLLTATVGFELETNYNEEVGINKLDGNGLATGKITREYFMQTAFDRMVLDQFLGWRFRLPATVLPLADPLLLLPFTGHAHSARVVPIMRDAKHKTIFRQTKQSTVREHFVSKPLSHGISYKLSDYEKRFMDIVTRIPSTFIDETIEMAEPSKLSSRSFDIRVLNIVYQGKRQKFIDMACYNPHTHKNLKVETRDGLCQIHEDTVCPAFRTNILLEPMPTLDNAAFFNLSNTLYTTSKLETHKSRMKELKVHCVPGHTFGDVILAWINFYTRLVADADHQMELCWRQVEHFREPFRKRDNSFTARTYREFEIGVARRLCEFMFNERLKQHLGRLWIEPLKSLLEEYKEARTALTVQSLHSPVHPLRQLTIGTRIDAVLTVMEHLWRREPSLIMIVASAHYDLIMWLANYFDDHNIEYVNFNKANYHGKRKALARIRENETNVRVIFYHFGGNTHAHEGSNLPEVSNILFLDDRSGPEPDEFHAERIQTQGRAYRHGQRYQINVIDFYDKEHDCKSLIPVECLINSTPLPAPPQ